MLTCWDAAGSDRALFARYRRDRDVGSRDALVDRFLPLAHHLARRYSTGGDVDDLHQIASIGLLKAIDRFDPDRGIAFSSFAVPTILGELRRSFRDQGWTVRVPRQLQELALRIERTADQLTAELGRAPTAAELAGHTGASAEAVLEALATRTAHRPDSLDRPYGDDEDDGMSRLGSSDDLQLSRIEDAAMLQDLLATLPRREQLILELRFRHELTQLEIGRRVGLSQMQVSRNIRASIATLQHAVAH